MTSRRVGLLGGTFDPIHAGHLKAAEAARDALGLTEVLLIAAHHPPHRQAEPVASSYHRFAMVALAVAGASGLLASDLEMGTPGPSYTSTTLRKLHALGLTPLQLFFITGLDAFAEIATWRDYPELLNLSHFVVVDRPSVESISLEGFGSRFPGLAGRLRMVDPPPDGLRQGYGGQDGGSHESRTSVFLLPAETPDVSSTGIRRRLRDGQSIDGLVPQPVAQHIARHRLYQAADGPNVERKT